MLQSIFQSHLATSSFGWLLYVVFVFTLEKNKADRKSLRFNYGRFFSVNWDNWTFSALLIIVVTQFAPEIWQLCNYAAKEEMPFNNAVYLLVGPLTEAIYFFATWIVIKAGIVLKALKTPTS